MEWKNRLIKPFTVEAEPCPNCGVEINILSNGKSNCSECGQKQILPCADCPRINNNLNTCDWNKKERCSEFPNSSNKYLILHKVRSFCEYELREEQTDNLFLGENNGSIYWVEGASTWTYVCGDITAWGQADVLLSNIKDDILLKYYSDNKEEIDEWFQDNK